MISITNLSKRHGKRVLFEDITLTVNRGEKIGLIGPNGAGKSTLFSLILKESEPSAGQVQVIKNTRIGYLPQESSFASGYTVLSEITEGDADIRALRAEKSRLEDEGKASTARYGEVLHILETLGFFELEYKAKKVLVGLGFKESDFDRRISELSGGWQMRTLLAKLLCLHYDILLLDEPTNYLDLNAALWLKSYLAGFKGTFIMISHDKAFLNDVTNYTLVLEGGQMHKVKGNYEQYERIKEERRTHLLKQYKETEKKREQLEKYVARFHAQPNKASSVRAKRTALEKLPEIIVPEDRRESIRNFRFPQTTQSGYQVISLNKVSKSYGENRVYRDLDFEVIRGERAVLAGENGAGKSTLLKIMAGVTGIDSGERSIGYNVEVGYFSQTRMDVLSAERTVLEEAYSAAKGYVAEEEIRTILSAFLFVEDDADKKVSVLSGGEKSRLILAKLLIRPPNFLLLDEPTTHLDVDAVDALVRALSSYSGTIVFISHDIHFVRSVANVVFEVKEGRVRKFPGGFDYYLETKDRPEFVGRKEVPKLDQEQERKKEEQEEQKRLEAERKDAEKKRKAHNTAIGAKLSVLRKEKEKLELEQYAKSRALSDPRIFRDEETVKSYGRRLKEIDKRIADIDEEIKILEEQRL